MSVKFELPIQALEPIFTALNTIKPNTVNRVEHRAINLLKTMLYLELEKMMETEDEQIERKINFKQLFNEERQKRQQGAESEKEVESVLK